MQPSISVAVARVQAWLKKTDRSASEIADQAQVDEKTVRLARLDGWNPRVETASRLEAVVPADFMPTAGRRRKAA